MKFSIEATYEFYKQLDGFNKKTKRIIDNKLQLLKENPYRFKKLS
jgi:mRNA-degrading endonuclease RelE of RelBE toxin-antitoxin system